ncbi:MAG TPA: 2-dehydropantoate 2-reductase [Xanthobacteraceae bacterium]
MRIGVMAAGAVGAYFGGRLAAAGHDVVFFARGANLAALRQNGLKIDSVKGDLVLPKVNATDDPTSVAPVDIVLFAVKLWDTESAAEQTRPIVGPATRVITLQNGVDSVERIAPILGRDNVVGGIAYCATVLSAPGVVSHTSDFAQIRCGRVDGQPDTMLTALVDAAKKANVDIVQTSTFEVDRWKKFVFLAAMSGMTSATREPLGKILADPDTRAMFESLLAEIVAVGRAKGVALPADFVEDRMKYAATTPFGFKASMAHDLDRGSRMELDWLAGRVVSLGRELGVPVPMNTAVYTVLKPHRMGKSA